MKLLVTIIFCFLSILSCSKKYGVEVNLVDETQSQCGTNTLELFVERYGYFVFDLQNTLITCTTDDERLISLHFMDENNVPAVVSLSAYNWVSGHFHQPPDTLRFEYLTVGDRLIEVHRKSKTDIEYSFRVPKDNPGMIELIVCANSQALILDTGADVKVKDLPTITIPMDLKVLIPIEDLGPTCLGSARDRAPGAVENRRRAAPEEPVSEEVESTETETETETGPVTEPGEDEVVDPTEPAPDTGFPE